MRASAIKNLTHRRQHTPSRSCGPRSRCLPAVGGIAAFTCNAASRPSRRRVGAFREGEALGRASLGLGPTAILLTGVMGGTLA
jgi:hypothetical protein